MFLSTLLIREMYDFLKATTDVLRKQSALFNKHYSISVKR